MDALFELPPAHKRPGAPVRRQSKRCGREGLFWQRFDRRDVGRFIVAAERFDRTTRTKGQKIGPLGPVGLEVWRELLKLVDYRTGRLEPAIKTIAERTRRSVSAVVAALKALQRHGFLDWLRRYAETDNEGRGPQVRQITNAYRLTLPARALALLGIHWGSPPLPEDEEARRTEQAEAQRAMLQSLPEPEQLRATHAYEPLGDAMARLSMARVSNERDSADQ